MELVVEGRRRRRAECEEEHDARVLDLILSYLISSWWFLSESEVSPSSRPLHMLVPTEDGSPNVEQA